MSENSETTPIPAGPEKARCGFAAILGAPNAGKSTLVNALVGQKISIVTQKVQTTRFPVRGVAIHGDAQIVLVDTPGVFTPKRRLDRAMVASAWGGAADADALKAFGVHAGILHGLVDGVEHLLFAFQSAVTAIRGFAGTAEHLVILVEHRGHHLRAAEIKADPEGHVEDFLFGGLGRFGSSFFRGHDLS